jgi:hypothetical protein
MVNNPAYPLYIPTKGRYMYMITSRVLTELGVKHHLIVEPQEVEQYSKAIYDMKLLATIVPLDLSYKSKYELCDDLGLTKSTGPGPARNFAWDDSIKKGFDFHWVMDDNLSGFRRLNNNEKVKVANGAIFKAMEDFCKRYKNVGMGGPNYQAFASARSKMPPFVKNTRIYSCNFIRNCVPYRWRGRYNEDTIISLDMLKAGWCTIQFNAFLQIKMQTQALKGGNTGEFYHKEGQAEQGKKYADTGTLAKSQMQVKVHPDVSKIVYKFSRIHHHVDYTPFKSLALILDDKLEIKKEVDNYGMNLIKKK